MKINKRNSLLLFFIFFYNISYGQIASEIEFNDSIYSIKYGNLRINLDSNLNSRQKVFSLFTKTVNIKTIFSNLANTDSLKVFVISNESNICNAKNLGIRVLITKQTKKLSSLDYFNEGHWYCLFYFRKLPDFIDNDRFELVYCGTEI